MYVLTVDHLENKSSGSRINPQEPMQADAIQRLEKYSAHVGARSFSEVNVYAEFNAL